MARRWKTFAFLGTEQDLFQGLQADNYECFYGFKAIFCVPSPIIFLV